LTWSLMLLILFGSLVFLMAIGMPVAFSFLLIILIGAPLTWGFEAGLQQVILSMADSVTKFSLLPLPLFILMGEFMFYSGVAPLMVDALDKWLGRLPGRLGLLAVGAGTLFGALSGASMAAVAMMGTTLMPEMEKRGYKKPMSLGPILGCGALDLMIPPSGLAVLLGALAEVSIGKLLIAIIVPGLLLAVLYAGYIIIRCKLQPSIAPLYDIAPTPLLQKCKATVLYVLPLGFIIFMVTGIIFIGVATPTEASATGVMASFILAAFYRKLNWEVLKKSLRATLEVTIMMFMILVAVNAYSQILAFSGAAAGFAEFVNNVHAAPIVIMISMQLVLLVLGMFISVVPIMMITVPIFMPIAQILGFNDIWFATIYLLNMGIAAISPPFGINLFVMKGVAPPHITMEDIYRAAFPFVYLDLVAMALIMVFPPLALWLPGMMMRY